MIDSRKFRANINIIKICWNLSIDYVKCIFPVVTPSLSAKAQTYSGKLQSCWVANNSVCSVAKCLKNLEAVRILLPIESCSEAMRVWVDQFSQTRSVFFQIRSVFSSSLLVFNRFSQRTVLTMLGLRASPDVHRTDSGRRQNAKSPLLNGLHVDHTI